MDASAAHGSRRAIPTKQDQTRLRKMMREAYSKEIADRTPGARKRLAQTLLDRAAKSTEYPADQYVLLTGAYSAATDAQSAKLCFDAANALTDGFEVEARSLKLGALAGQARLGDADDAKTVVGEALAMIGSALRDGDYDAIRKAAGAIELAAPRTKNAGIASAAREQVRTARAIADQSAQVQGDFATLLRDPEDAAASRSVGRFLCLVKRDWTAGLPKLARGDSALKALAARELAGGAVADDWWTAADQEPVAIARAAMRAHAADLYDQSLVRLEGLAAALAQQRMASVAAEEAAVKPIFNAARRGGPQVKVSRPSDTTEAHAIIADVVAAYPDLLKEVKQVELLKMHDASSMARRAGGPEEIPDSYSAKPIAGSSDFIMLCGVYEEWDPAKYLIVYRAQLLSQATGGNVCFLDICVDSGNKTIAERRPAATEFKAKSWQAIPVLLDLKDKTQIEYRLWPNNHKIALDRIYIFRVS